MRKRIVVIMCALFSFTVFKCIAQEKQNFVGIKGGISIPNLTAHGSGNNPLNTGYSSRLGPNAAIFWEQAITRNFSILSGIEYSSQRRKETRVSAISFSKRIFRILPRKRYLHIYTLISKMRYN